MQNTIDIGWFDIGVREDSSLAVLDHGRLPNVVNQLPDPQNQYPSLCVFLGRQTKDHALQRLYNQNNIKRHVSKSMIQLRYDVASFESREPVLLADGDIMEGERFHPKLKLDAGMGQPVSWDNYSAGRLLQVLWSRLVFLFADIVCIFIDDTSNMRMVEEFLVNCMELGSASSLPRTLLPRLVVIYRTGATNKNLERSFDSVFYEYLQKNRYKDLSELFSKVSFIGLHKGGLSETANYLRIKAYITDEVTEISFLRQVHHARPNATHFQALFQSAFHHTLDNRNAFDVVKATRRDRPVCPSTESNLVHYLEIADRARLSSDKLAPSIASALFMDHYVLGMFATNPRDVFGSLYRKILIQAHRKVQETWSGLCPEEQTNLIERHFSEQFDLFSGGLINVADLRKQQLESQSGRLSCLRSNLICLFCLLHSAQHVLDCGHTFCDRCAQVYGEPVAGLEYQFTVTGCLYCLYRKPLIVDVLPPTISPSILALDGGGVRGVIPLEYLLLVQEHLQPSTIHNVVDLAIGTSSGGLIALGLFAMLWDVAECSERFNTLANQIFRQRRRSILPPLLFHVSGYKSLLGELVKWIQWLLHDSCYDSQVFDAALKSAFRENRRLFGATRERLPGHRRSGLKVGVIATSISRDTSAFVIGNFNISEDSKDKYSKLYQPLLYFEGVGSFQDSGLKHNFAGEVASQVSNQIWPLFMGSIRMISIGTGKAPSNKQIPHFRHVFRDGFIRRGFNA
ncbi:uncharacterized protein N7473_012532 [Penicillium subrubescens]|uniref:uncharacterized protein n=1 Tax=Penicillium subrubescens TaxID=1316194 RepID=UPI00254553BB|nr:uncharacterized protein N7473_012532 [Penicillium subrubescens]KAJ5875185.1 hypothetical protein N7473_012532 [Penicillium subrubescens]